MTALAGSSACPAATSAKDMGTGLVAAVDEFVGDARPHDNLSLIVLRRAL